MTVIKKPIGNAFMTIPSTYMQQWSSPKFNMGSVSRQGVAVGRNERTITDVWFDSTEAAERAGFVRAQR